jgi:hypothetical protein
MEKEYVYILRSSFYGVLLMTIKTVDSMISEHTVAWPIFAAYQTPLPNLPYVDLIDTTQDVAGKARWS